MKELGTWLALNPSAVVLVDLEDVTTNAIRDAPDRFVNAPIEKYLGARVFKPTDDPGFSQADVDDPMKTKPWPSLEELRQSNKQVIFTAKSENHGGEWIWLVPQNPFKTQQAQNFYYTTATYNVPAVANNGRPPTVPPAWNGGDFQCVSWPAEHDPENPVYFDFTRKGPAGHNKPGKITVVYEARSAPDALEPTGFFDEVAVSQLATCHLSFISLDRLHGKEHTSAMNCDIASDIARTRADAQGGTAAQAIAAGDTAKRTCNSEDERIKASVWSWKEDDRGQFGDAALFDSRTERWESRKPAEEHHYACARPREGAPSSWSDDCSSWQNNEHWKVTQRKGAWTEGGVACLEEFPETTITCPSKSDPTTMVTVTVPAYTFAVPLTGWQNAALDKVVPADKAEVWLNYNDISEEGNWQVNRRPVAAVDGTPGDGVTTSQLEGSVHGYQKTFVDPDGDAIDYSWDFDDGTTVSGLAVKHAYANDGNYGTRIIAKDRFAGANQVSFDVRVDDVTATITDSTLDRTAIDEGSSVTLSGTFTDPGADTHTVEIDWGDGSVQTGIQSDGTSGPRTFTATHVYADNSESPDTGFLIGFTVTDTTRATAVARTSAGAGTEPRIVVNNVAPVISDFDGSVSNEGAVVDVTFTIADPGTADVEAGFTLTVDWGEGAVETFDAVELDALGHVKSGHRREPDGSSLPIDPLALQHVYLDDDPTRTPTDDYTVTLAVTDKDAGSDIQARVNTVRNENPVAAIDSITDEAGAEIGRDVQVALVGLVLKATGSYTDLGVLDTHWAVFDWGDASDSDLGNVVGGGAASHVYDAADEYMVSLTVMDDDLGEDSPFRAVSVVTPEAACHVVADELEAIAGAERVGVRLRKACGRISTSSGNATFDIFVMLEKRIQDLESLEPTSKFTLGTDPARSAIVGPMQVPVVGLTYRKSLIALIAKSLLLEVTDEAESGPQSIDSERSIVHAHALREAGDRWLEDEEWVFAAHAYKESARQLLGMMRRQVGTR